MADAPGARPADRRPASSRVGVAYLLLVLVPVAIALGARQREQRHEGLARGAALWVERCDSCHSLLRSLSPKDAHEWTATMGRPAHAGMDDLSRSESRAIQSYLIEANSLPDAYGRSYWLLRSERERFGALFETKCGSCHEPAVAPRAVEDAGWLYWSMERDRRRNVFRISVSDQQQIFEYLHLGDLDSPLDFAARRCPDCHSHRFALAYLLGWDLPREEARTDARGSFAKRCFACHTESILTPCRTPSEWDELVERMRLKSPELIAKSEAERISAYLGGSACEDDVVVPRRPGGENAVTSSSASSSARHTSP